MKRCRFEDTLPQQISVLNIFYLQTKVSCKCLCGHCFFAIKNSQLEYNDNLEIGLNRQHNTIKMIVFRLNRRFPFICIRFFILFFSVKI